MIDSASDDPRASPRRRGDSSSHRRAGSAGFGRSSLGNNAGNGVAALAAVDLGLSGFAVRLQGTWHRASATVSAIDQTTTVVATEVGLSLTF